MSSAAGPAHREPAAYAECVRGLICAQAAGHLSRCVTGLSVTCLYLDRLLGREMYKLKLTALIGTQAAE
jgi:hypothetical protein